MMRYRLRTLMVVAGVVPPLSAFVWFNWQLILFVVLFFAFLALWVYTSMAMARFFGWLVASVMD